jgi:tRNA pseudouridine55 synthase
MDGILIVDKPTGLTSHDVVARARRILKIKRIGHTGTLDPFATGVLVLLIGRATRLAQFLNAAEKEYEAVIRFGYATTTGDTTGSPKSQVPSPKSESEVSGQQSGVKGTNPQWSASNSQSTDLGLIKSAMAELTGEIEQVPPMYSAKKIEGKKLYELARRGVEIERKPARVSIKTFEILPSADGAETVIRNVDGTFDVRARVVCSAGTYIRALAESLGERVGAGAHLAALRRMRAGQFTIHDAVGLDELQSLAETNLIGSKLISMNAALAEMPFAHLSDEEAHRVRHGASVRARKDEWAEGTRVRLCDAAGELIAIGEYARAQIQPRILLAA